MIIPTMLTQGQTQRVFTTCMLGMVQEEATRTKESTRKRFIYSPVSGITRAATRCLDAGTTPELRQNRL